MRRTVFLILLCLMVATALNAQQQVSGIIDGETWSVSQSPFHVVGDLEILQLTIEPGVEVRFDGNYRMVVHGVLKVLASEDDSVVFKASATNSTGWAGIFFENADPNSFLTYCQVRDVSSNPAIEILNTDLTLKHLTIHFNQAIGVQVSNSVVTLERCQIVHNGQTGLLTDNSGQSTLIACQISANEDNGVEVKKGQTDLKNSIVAFNKQEGVLLSETGSNFNSVNSIIVYNENMGVANFFGNFNIKNSIVYFNKEATQIYGNGKVTYSDVAQNISGTGNIMQDPLFADTVTFALSASSPAIDAGDPQTQYNDLYFPPSLGGTQNDMGIYGGPYARKWFPPVFIAPDSLNFGNVSLNDTLTLTFKIKNYSDQTLTIRQITLDGPNKQFFFLVGSFDNISLPMADSLMVPVVFYPTEMSSLPYTAQVLIDTDLGPETVPLTGQVVAPNIFALPDAIDFGTVRVGHSDSLHIKLFNTGTDTLFVDSLKHKHSVFAYSLDYNVLPPNSENFLNLTVSFQPDTIGLITDTLKVFSNDPDDSPLLLPLSGEGLAPLLRFTPHVLDFDSVLALTDSVQTFEIVNEGNDLLTVQAISVADIASHFSVEASPPLQIAAGQSSGPIAVHFNPDSTRNYADTLLITSNDPFKPLQKLPLTGTGTGAFLVVSRARFDFGLLVMPEDSLLRLTIKNLGNIDLTIKSITIQGDDAASFSWWKTSGDLQIAPHTDSLQIYLRCLPQKSGALQAILKIESNDLWNPQMELPLMALVKAPELALEPDTVRFDSTLLFAQRQQLVKLFNRGDYQLTIDSFKVQLSPNADLQFPTLTMPLTLEPKGDTVEIPIAFHPQKIGWQNATLQFYSNDPFRNPRELHIFAQAVEPKLYTMNDTLNFGRYSIYRQPTESILLLNDGDAPVVIDSIVVADSNIFVLESHPQRILPNTSGVPLTVRFKPPQAGTFNSRLNIYWNNPYRVPTTIQLIGQADSAQLKVPAQIDFGKQLIKNDYQRTLKIYNQSRVFVFVDSMRLSGPDAAQFSLPPFEFPLILSPEDSVFELQLSYHPQQTGVHQAQVTIYSQDIESHLLAVTLKGTALYSSTSPLLVCSLTDSLEFGAVFVNEHKTVQFSLFNGGNVALQIDSMVIQNTPESCFTLTPSIVNQSLAAGDTLSNLSLQFSPNKAQNYRAVLAIYSNDPENGLWHLPLIGQGKVDPTPAEVHLNPDTLQLVLGQQAKVQIRIVDDSTTIQSALLYVRPGGSSKFTSLAMQSEDHLLWETQLPSDFLTISGVEAYFKITHGGRETLYPEQGESAPLYLTVTVPEITYPFFTRKEKYQMISLPFRSDLSLKELFGDDLGSYNPEKYRIFDWDAAEEKFIEQKDLKRKLTPGKALYLITRDSLSLDASQLQTVPTTGNWEIAVENGWNLIANPFPFSVDWNEVTKNWPLVPILYDYTGSGWTISNRLEPFKGYAVNLQGQTTLSIPPVQSTLAKTAPLFSLQWSINLSAQSEGFKDLFNLVGQLNSRQTAKRWYFPEPPVIGSYVSLYFEGTQGEHLTADLRSKASNGYRFPFFVEWNTGRPVYINVTVDSLPKGWGWQVVSLNNRLMYNAPPIKLEEPQNRLCLLVGTTDFLRQETQNFLPVPKQFKLNQNYPNPFNQTTHIKFQLPESDRLTIQIFDITGRVVKTLVQQATFEAGYHKLRWDGNNQNGLPVASGIYFLYLNGQKFSAVKKLILQK